MIDLKIALLFPILAAVVIYAEREYFSFQYSVGDEAEPGNLVKQNFARLSNKALNKQITQCLAHSYKYLAMAFYFQQYDIALPGFHKMFEGFSERERKNAKDLMSYVTLRGGEIKLSAIKAPKEANWSNGLSAIEEALIMEKKANSRIRDMHRVALDEDDPHLKQYLEDGLITQKVEVIQQLGEYITQLKRVQAENDGLGLYIFDQDHI